ncbi:MAG: ABC transporter permease [Acutalibacteraceae bacterium]
MNIVNKLTLRHLKENMSRTVVTVLGICVSVAMITAVFVATASVLNLFGEIELLTGGHQHAIFTVDETQLEKLEEDDRIKNIGLRPAEKTLQFQLDDRATDRTGTGDIYIGDKVNLEQMFTGQYDGEVPENENEIAVEQSLIEKNNLDWKIGDTVTVPIGYRYYTDNESGEQVLIFAGSYTGGEIFECTGKKEYKITAILHGNPPTSDYCSIVRGLDIGKTPLANGEKVQAYIELKDVNYKSRETINDIVKEYNITKYTVNDTFLQTEFSFDPDGMFMRNLLPMILIVLVIIIIASVMLIYNAFAMSLSERVRYLGMLASVGATKAQKKLSVYFEGAILGAVGIPVGVLAGIVGIGITLKAVGSKIIQTCMLSGVNDSDIQMKVTVPVWAIAGIIIFSIITIFISLYIPSGKASKITPIDAIRQRDEIKVKAKKLKSPKLIRKVFGYEGELAYKNLKRNGRKSKVITVSIALSVVLFLSCNYFCSLFSESIDMETRLPYQIQALVNIEHKEDFEKELDNIPQIDDYYPVLSFYESPGKYEKGKENHPVVNNDFLTSKYKNLFNSKSQLFVNIIDDEDFNTLCKNNSIDSSKYYGDSTKALLMNNISHKENSSEVFNNKIIGTEFTVKGAEGSNIEIADLVKYDSKFYVCSLNPERTISLYIPETQYYNVVQKNAETPDSLYFFGIETEHHAEATEIIQNIMDENDYGGTYVSDYIESMQTMSTFTFVMQVFIYGFIALITLITTANIINTISTGIAMRKKEFAMLKSVGVTPKGFRKIISLESVFYALKALPVSLLLSIGISYGMNKGGGLSTIPFEVNIPLYIGVVLVVCAIIGATMLYAVSKLKDDSIVETLKEEVN